MLYLLFAPRAKDFIIFNLFRYETFRTGGAILTALFLSFVIGPWLIRALKLRQGKGQPIREDGPQSHLLTKKGTPTMGGFLILLAVTVATFLWADLSNRYVWYVMLVTLGYGLLGFMDDYLKVTKRNAKGVSVRVKLVVQFAIACLVVFLIMQESTEALRFKLALPFLKNALIDLGPIFILFGMLVVVFSSNAVNLTDGLDGLAIVPVM